MAARFPEDDLFPAPSSNLSRDVQSEMFSHSYFMPPSHGRRPCTSTSEVGNGVRIPFRRYGGSLLRGHPFQQRRNSLPISSPPLSNNRDDFQKSVASPNGLFTFMGSGRENRRLGANASATSADDDTASQTTCTDFSHLNVEIASNFAESARFCVILQPGWGPRVNPNLVSMDESVVAGDTSESLSQLRTTSDEGTRVKIIQNLIKRNIPRSADIRNFCELLQCMTIRNNDVKEEAIVSLETAILRFRQYNIQSYTDQLWQVASQTLTAFLNNGTNSSETFVYLHLHLMTLSLLTSTAKLAQKNSLLQSFTRALKIRKKERGHSEPKQRAMDALRMFYKYFKDSSKACPPFQCPPDWASLDWGRTGRLELRELFRFVSFGQHVVYMYSLLNEISHQSWSLLGKTLLLGLQNLCKTLPRTGKHKSCGEVMDFALVRCLNILLCNLFARDKSPVGKDNRDHNGQIADIILEVIRTTSDPSHKELLMREITYLPFHNAQVVRQIFNCCLSGSSKESPIEFYKRAVVGYMEENLRLVGFQRDRTGSTERVAWETNQECTWVDIICSVGNRPAQGAVYVPKPSCLGKSMEEMFMCVSDHPGRTEATRSQKNKSRQHCKNLDNLILLSLGCKNIIKLLAYQIQPFPFYITEAIEYRRLLEYLIDHRSERQWISDVVLVQVVRDVIQALSHMCSRKMVTADVTAYNMIVELTDTYRGNSRESAMRSLTQGNFVIKLADMSLVLKQRTGTGNRQEVEVLSFPVRWTSPEMLLDGECSEKSMVYSLAFLMYECWTHGCQPFTFYDKGMTTSDILMSFFGRIEGIADVRVNKWPCFPEEVYSLIQRCVQLDPSSRPSLQEVDDELKNISVCEESDGDIEPQLESAIRWNKKYPLLSAKQQERRHIPEMPTNKKRAGRPTVREREVRSIQRQRFATFL